MATITSSSLLMLLLLMKVHGSNIVTAEEKKVSSNPSKTSAEKDTIIVADKPSNLNDLLQQDLKDEFEMMGGSYDGYLPQLTTDVPATEQDNPHHHQHHDPHHKNHHHHQEHHQEHLPQQQQHPHPGDFQDFISSLQSDCQCPPGLQGPVGMPGLPGNHGIMGPRGPPGSRGHTGSAGLKGQKGQRGERGHIGRTGPKGDIGPPCETPQMVAFSLQGRRPFHNDIIHWQHVLTNVGDIVVSDDQYLRMPLNGMYFLTWSATNNSDSKSNHSILLVVSDKMVGTSTTTEIASGNHALLQLREGDVIWLRHGERHLSLTVTFSGYLIWPSMS